MSLEITNLYVVYCIRYGGGIWLANETLYTCIEDACVVRDKLMEDTRHNSTLPPQQMPKYFTATLDDFISEYGSARYEEGYYQGHEACKYSMQYANE